MQPFHRYMLAKRRQVVHFKEGSQVGSVGANASFYSILLHPQGATLITVISGRMRPEGNGYLGEDKSIKWFRRRDEQ